MRNAISGLRAILRLPFATQAKSQAAAVKINRKTLQARRGRVIVLGTLAFFVLGQVGLLATMSVWRQELRDPQYGLKLAPLRDRMAQKDPTAPLVLALGSSRVGMGIRPGDAADCWPADMPAPVVFNVARNGGGPLWELIYLHRLLDDGVHPDLLLLEVWPFYMHKDGPLANEDKYVDPRHIQKRDWPLLRRYCPKNREIYRTWRDAQFAPWHSQRYLLLNLFAPKWLPAGKNTELTWVGFDDWGWQRVTGFDGHDPETWQQRVATTGPGLIPLLRNFDPGPRTDQILRELLELCRQRNIRVALIFMPESAPNRGWYSELALAQFDGYLRGLSTDFNVPVIDARAWSADEDFTDSYHLAADGATRFTRRLVPEVLSPMLNGASISKSAMANDP